MQYRNLLAIDTSCDDSAVAILNHKNEICADVVYSQNTEHAPYGGVVPEISSRQHLGRIAFAVQKALDDAGLQPKDIDAVAVTFGPGLIGSLLVGVQFAKGFAQALGVPLIGIHHIEGHLMAAYGETMFPTPPFISLIVSGGHSAIYWCGECFQFKTLGETRDDAAGEAFDKVGRLLGLGYPAGKAIDELAENGDASRFTFPIALRSRNTLDFSFSGLKTAARLVIEKLRNEVGDIRGQILNDFCAGLRKAVVEALLNKAFLACKQHQITHLVLGGGVAANSLLREQAILHGRHHNVNVYLPPKNHCVDNAVMIARAARRRLECGQKSSLELDVIASIGIDDISLMSQYQVG